MINTVVNLQDIRFTFKDPGNLLSSIEKRGIAIAVYVDVVKDGYVCIDGHRRLSACQILAKKDSKFTKIPVVLMNDYSKSGSSFWGNTQNRH